MGKSSKPTRLQVHPSLLDWPEIKELQAQGHEVWSTTDYRMPPVDPDLILGPNCWRMDESLKPYLLSLALPAARKAADERKKRASAE